MTYTDLAEHYPCCTQLLDQLEPEIHQQLTAIFSEKQNSLDQLEHVLSCSLWVREYCARQPDNVLAHISRDRFTLDGFIIEITPVIADTQDALDRELRRARAQWMFHIIWCDLNRLWTLEDTCRALSTCARVAIQSALDFHYQALCARYGTPKNSTDEAQPMLVIGMGKLGADELNLSSDIDLIFCFPDNGHCDGESALENHAFFSKLGKKIIQSLDAQTAEGRVFRVDMRLRPYGQSGALVHSFDALEEYYLTQGREWERYAMVKAAVVANNGAEHYAKDLMQLLRSFTYRRYIDFSVIDALRQLKQRIQQEVKRRRLDNDVKLSRGGIREIEFIAQVFQLLRGGREPRLQENRILKVLPMLAEDNSLPQEDVAALIQAYIFLRNTEHALQAYRDEQTQSLPHTDEQQIALTQAMGFSSYPEFLEVLDAHRSEVAEHFDEVIAAPAQGSPSSDESLKVWQDIWQGLGEDKSVLRLLGRRGYEDPQASLTRLRDLHQWAHSIRMQNTSLERLEKFMPVLLQRVSQFERSSELLTRAEALIKAVTRRSAYVLLLMENPSALDQWLRLSEASPWFAEHIAAYPALLDELLDTRALYTLPDKATLASELQRDLLRIPEDDTEMQMESTRYFRLAHALRVAACELTETLPLMKVSDYLSDLAETILQHVLNHCWQEMVKRHGYPDGQLRETPKFIVVAYGKLGGIELGHSSDLDLVFIHDAALSGESDGPRVLDNQTYFTRLGQKMIHFLTANMSSGPLYEVDMRLRPSGNSGLLVTRLSAFEKYQRESAWTWEHQALVRARCVAGDPELARKFEQVRHLILCQPRDRDALRQEVSAMRNKMRKHLTDPRKSDVFFDLKQDPGGIVDIEFMVQYGALAWAQQHPALVTHTDNIRILASFADAGLLATHEVHQLTDAYLRFRAAGHRLALQKTAAKVDAKQFLEERQNVQTLWQRLIEKPEP